MARNPKHSITHGMKNAMGRYPGTGKACPDCGLSLPKYPGVYPANCPDCGGEFPNSNTPSITAVEALAFMDTVEMTEPQPDGEISE